MCHCRNMGVKWTQNMSLHRQLTLENTNVLPLLPGFELATFWSWVWHSITWAILTLTYSYTQWHINILNIYISMSCIFLLNFLSGKRIPKSVHSLADFSIREAHINICAFSCWFLNQESTCFPSYSLFSPMPCKSKLISLFYPIFIYPPALSALPPFLTRFPPLITCYHFLQKQTPLLIFF